MPQTGRPKDGIAARAELETDPALEIDITGDICPMTFVRTRLALDRLASGQLLQVRLRGEEPRRNVPRTAQDQGHEVLELSDLPDGSTRLVLRTG